MCTGNTQRFPRPIRTLGRCRHRQTWPEELTSPSPRPAQAFTDQEFRPLMITRLYTKVRSLVTVLWREVAKFGVVGGVAFLIDSAVFLWLISGPMDDSHVKSKAIAVAIATVFSWIGNRYWTFRHRRTKTKTRELVMFFLMNLIGLGIQSGCVVVSYYLLGLQSATASFVSGSIVGMGLAMCFRFVAYKFWVFTGDAEPEHHDSDGPHMLSDRELLTGEIPVVQPGKSQQGQP